METLTVKRIHTIYDIEKPVFLHDSSGTYGMGRLIKYSTTRYVSVPVHDEQLQ